ncbi:MAG: PAS domain-containing sensor histidine kinase [Candidatus Thermoplasmatota archaeon]
MKDEPEIVQQLRKEEQNKKGSNLNLEKKHLDNNNVENIKKDLLIKDYALLSSINAIILTDLDKKITYVNPSFLRTWKYNSEKRVIGKKIGNLVKNKEDFDKILDEVFEKGGWQGEIIAKKKNGKYFPVQLSITLVKDNRGDPLCIMASFVDITRQKRLEKKYKKFKVISDNAGYGSIIYDLDNFIIYVNKAFSEMHGYNQEELIGKKLSIFYEKNSLSQIRSINKDLKEKGNVTGKEIWHKKKNGNVFPVLITATYIENEKDNFSFIAATVSDITEIKKKEKKLEEYAKRLKEKTEKLKASQDELSSLNQNLEKKVKERTLEINKLLRQKNDFINQLGHDLKNPLTPLVTLVPLVKEKEEKPENKKLLKVIMRNVNYIKNLVEKTIELARLNSPQSNLSFEKINLYKKTEKVINKNELLIEKNNVKVVNNIPKDIFIRAAPFLIQEVLNNVLINAVNYGEKAGDITFDAEKEENNLIKVSVHDTGIGLTEDQKNRIFEEFYKVDEARHDFNSSGLGLSICKRIIEQHGGEIWAESPGLNKGTTFYFTVKEY